FVRRCVVGANSFAPTGYVRGRCSRGKSRGAFRYKVWVAGFVAEVLRCCVVGANSFAWRSVFSHVVVATNAEASSHGVCRNSGGAGSLGARRMNSPLQVMCEAGVQGVRLKAPPRYKVWVAGVV